MTIFSRVSLAVSNAGEQAFPGKGRLKERDEELARLRKENEILRQERDILKMAVGIFSRVPK
jgi:transposase